MPPSGPPLSVYGKGEESSIADDFWDQKIIAGTRTRLRALLGQQEKLAETRERLLIDRDTVLEDRKRLRDQRIHTGDAEGGLMNAFRNVYNRLGIPLPEDLTSAYTLVEEQRNKLGYLEDNHLRAEQDLGASEWTLMEMENDLYQYDLQQILLDEGLAGFNDDGDDKTQDVVGRSDPMLPSITVQYQVAVADLNRLANNFKILRKSSFDKIDMDRDLVLEEAYFPADDDRVSDYVRLFSDLLGQITDCEVIIQHLKMEGEPHGNSLTPRTRRLSVPVPRPTEACTDYDVPSRALSDSMVPVLSEDVSIMDRVQDWLLHYLKTNAVERLQYMSILEQEMVHRNEPRHEFEDYEERINQSWLSTKTNSMTWSCLTPPIARRRTSQSKRFHGPASFPGNHELQNLAFVPRKQQFSLGFDDNFKYEPVPTLFSVGREGVPQLQIDGVSAKGEKSPSPEEKAPKEYKPGYRESDTCSSLNTQSVAISYGGSTERATSDSMGVFRFSPTRLLFWLWKRRYDC
ncbi:hypothetical protein EJ02DRAFT_512612 [Clathrospora elynae]|uniref:Uncharacterized protein n=1 Tax=Clathrospora elynae TaxID=706981 RepID=A0A6A5SRH4_9PLEO|nr:hypothetical protein EJ02DRAFT_512612 [Clathrospora elynae]